MTEWLTGMKTAVRSSTHATYTTLVDTHIKKNLGSVRLQDLTAARLNALYSDLLTKGRANGKGGLSPATVRYVHSVIRKALSDAMKENLITRNVADAARVPRVSRPQIRTWSAREVRTFLNHVREDPSVRRLCPRLHDRHAERRGRRVALAEYRSRRWTRFCH